MISTGELKRGITIELDGQLFNVLEFQHQKIGRGSAQVKLKLRNLQTGSIVDRTFQAGERFQRARLEHHTVEFLYRDGDNFHFMDTETYEQPVLTIDHLGDDSTLLKEGTHLELLTHEGTPISVEMPITVDLAVAETDPGFKGDTATGGNKPATVETGRTVQVPLFVNMGDVIRIDTRTGQYIERVSK